MAKAATKAPKKVAGKQQAGEPPKAEGQATPTKRKPKRRTKGALTAITALLVASALVRIGIGASQAIAREDPAAAAHAPADDHGNDMVAADAHGGESTTHAGTPAAIADEDLLPLINSLKAREERVNQREEAIDVRMQALRVAEQEIERKLVALEDAEQKLKATMELASSAAENDLQKLTDVYANMKPKQAALLFEQMDPKFAAGFLGRMRADSAAAIMAGMAPDAAYLVSVILAGRNADVPDQ
jgi:flagellar motility protein MotE (MotC chaperone)